MGKLIKTIVGIVLFLVPRWRTDLGYYGSISVRGGIGSVNMQTIKDVSKVQDHEYVIFTKSFSWLGVGFGRYPIIGTWKEVKSQIRKTDPAWYRKYVK